MNQAASYLASSEILRVVIQNVRLLWKGGWDKGVISKRKMKVCGRKLRVQGDDGSSLAELWHFLLDGLVAGPEENLPPAGLVKSIQFQLEMQGTSCLG